jgi:hypothetical protein
MVLPSGPITVSLLEGVRASQFVMPLANSTMAGAARTIASMVPKSIASALLRTRVAWIVGSTSRKRSVEALGRAARVCRLVEAIKANSVADGLLHRNCSTRLNDSFPVQDGANCLIRIESAACRRTNNGSNGSEQIGTPV